MLRSASSKPNSGYTLKPPPHPCVSTKYVIKRINKKQIDRGKGTLLIYVAGAPDQTITQGRLAVIKTNKIENNKLKHELLRK